MDVMKHLTEQEIQDIAGGKDLSCPEVKRAHLAECPDCRVLFRFYRALAEAVKNESRFTLSSGFPGRVIQAMQSEKDKRSLWFERILTGGCVFFGAVIALFYLNKNGMVSRWADTLNHQLITQAGQMIPPDTGQSFVLPLFIIFLLIMFQAADRLLIRRKANVN